MIPNQRPRSADDGQVTALHHTLVATPISDESVSCFQRITAAYGVGMHELTDGPLRRFRLAAVHARDAEEHDPAIRAELAAWGADDEEAAQTIPLRSFLPDDAAILAGPGRDGGARYFVLSTAADDPAFWLAAGEAISAVLTEATADGLGVSPMTDVVEVPSSRDSLRRLIGADTEPQAALRIEIPSSPVSTLPERARRASQLIVVIGSGEGTAGG